MTSAELKAYLSGRRTAIPRDPRRVAQPLGVNLLVADPSSPFEVSKDLIPPLLVLNSVDGVDANSSVLLD
jgi:hypothetical protein